MKLGPPEREDFTDEEVRRFLHPTPTKEDRYKELVKDWTRKARSSSYTDEERNIYYDCSEQLHNILQKGSLCSEI